MGELCHLSTCGSPAKRVLAAISFNVFIAIMGGLVDKKSGLLEAMRKPNRPSLYDILNPSNLIE
jgi:hypothetical protein